MIYAPPLLNSSMWLLFDAVIEASRVLHDLPEGTCPLCKQVLPIEFGTVMIGATAPLSFHHIARQLRFHGFVPKTIHDVATSLGPMCEKCLKDWAKELSSN
jgi:hypothetical protein